METERGAESQRSVHSSDGIAIAYEKGQVRDRLVELRRATVYPMRRSRAMRLAVPHLAQETTR